MRLAWVLLLVACNEVYGLDETTLRPPQPDRDLDGVFDEDDNCRDVANEAQDDGDRDGFGDACDGCSFATTENHDEDLDGRGDDCDSCPHVPDFGDDLDGDGVGDRCESIIASGPNTKLVGFDSFGVPNPAWYSTTVAWLQDGDAVVASATVPLGDPGLRNDTIAVTTRDFFVAVGVVAKRPLVAGDHLGIGLVDDTGATIYSCTLACPMPGDCRLEVRVGPTSYMYLVYPVQPVDRLELQRVDDGIYCSGRPTGLTTFLSTTDPTTRLRPALFGAPRLQISYVAMFEER